MRSTVQSLIVALLLVVIMGLLLVFAQKAREAAGRTQCTNNSKQINLACQNYSDTFEHFPPAAQPNPALPPERRLGWLVLLGPFIDANFWSYRVERDKGWDRENRFLALTIDIKTYRCPAYPDRPLTSTLIPTHYIGMAGIGADAAGLRLSDPKAGFMGYDRRLKRADVEDHAGTLLVLLETSQAQGAWCSGGPASVRGLMEETPYLGPNGQFGGLHPGVAMAGFADGSVRFLDNRVEPRVLEALATIEGSKTAEQPGGE